MNTNLAVHVIYLKAERPNRYKFLTENVDKIKTTSTLEEVEEVFNFISDMFEAEPIEIEAFNYLVWQKLGYKMNLLKSGWRK